MVDRRGAEALRGLYLDELSDEAVVVITDQQPRKTSPLSVLFIFSLGNGYADVGDDDTAFGGSRSAQFSVFIVAAAENPDALPADRAWVRAFWEALLPHAMGSGSYINSETDFEEDRVRITYGEVKYERLARIKAKYAPDNVFHLNANIKPALQPI